MKNCNIYFEVSKYVLSNFSLSFFFLRYVLPWKDMKNYLRYDLSQATFKQRAEG